MQDHIVHLAIDLMGGDQPPQERLQAVSRFLRKFKDCKLSVFIGAGLSEEVQSISHERLNFIVCDSTVEMDESPLKALRHKRNSSLSDAIRFLADGEADVAVTAGNTGAMVALARHWLKPLGDGERPALATLLPSRGNRTLLLDVGATVDYRATDLFSLAHMGAEAAIALNVVESKPRVALLNVGTESIKGSDTVQQADRLLQESELNYIGYCEGKHLFDSYADVVCCDGFVGNITLKACEGMAELLSPSRKGGFSQFFSKLGSTSLNPAHYNGALLLGLDGLVIKSHGDSDAMGFFKALEQARSNVLNRLIIKMKQKTEQ